MLVVWSNNFLLDQESKLLPIFGPPKGFVTLSPFSDTETSDRYSSSACCRGQSSHFLRMKLGVTPHSSTHFSEDFFNDRRHKGNLVLSTEFVDKPVEIVLASLVRRVTSQHLNVRFWPKADIRLFRTRGTDWTEGVKSNSVTGRSFFIERRSTWQTGGSAPSPSSLNNRHAGE